MKFCRVCGTPCEDETVFCRVCGTKFRIRVSVIGAGLDSEYYITDYDAMEAVLDKPAVFITDEHIPNIRCILPLLEEVVKNKRQLLIIADSFDSEVRTTLLVNKLKNIIAVAAIEARGFGEYKKDILGDIAVLTGGNVFCSDTGLEVENATLSMCGQAKEARITMDETVITGGYTDEFRIEERVSRLREQLADAGSEKDKESIRSRLANLFGVTE